MLARGYFLKASKNFKYLSFVGDRDFVSQPYELTNVQYKMASSLDGSHCLCDLKKKFPNVARIDIDTFIEQLKSLGAIQYEQGKKLRIFSPPSKDPHLRGVHFELTKVCNLKCLHCYQRNYVEHTSEKQLSLSEIESLADSMEKLNVINVSISGGEPFTFANLDKVINIFEKRGIRVGNIFSNGVMINDKMINMLKRAKSNPRLVISLDGCTPKTHGIIRGIQPSERKRIFKKIINNINKLSQAGFLLTVNTTVYKENISTLEDIYKLLKKMKVYVWRLAIPKFAGAFISNTETVGINLDSKELKKAYLKLIETYLNDIAIEKKHIVIPMDLRISNVFKTEMLVEPIVKYSLNDAACQYRKDSISVQFNGDIMSCGMLTDFIFGNIRKKSLEKIWYSKKTQHIKNIKIGDIEECKTCKYHGICGGGCRVNSWYEFKTILNKDSDTCKCFNFFPDVKKLSHKYGFKINIVNKHKQNKNRKKILIRDTNYAF